MQRHWHWWQHLLRLLMPQNQTGQGGTCGCSCYQTLRVKPSTCQSSAALASGCHVSP
jgi:hypothetical protein